MNLSFSLLTEYLPPEMHAELLGDSRKGRNLSRPVLYEGEGILASDRVYVSRTDLLPPVEEISSRCLVCVGRSSVRELVSMGCTVLRVSGTENYIRVYNAICEIYDRFDIWENTLREQLEQEENFDYHTLAVTGAEMLDNTIGMSDQFLHVLFTTEQNADGTFRIAEGKYSDMLLDIDEEITAVCEKEKQLRKPYISAFTHQGDFKPYCCNICPIDHFAGCCFIYPDRHPFRDSDFEIANVFFRYFSRAFTKYIRGFNSQESSSAQVIRSLLLGQPLSREEKRLLALQESESWLLFRLRPRSGVRAMPLEFMLATIASLMPQTAYAGQDGEEITGILRVQASAALEECPGFSSFHNILLHMGYIAGLSNTFRELNSFREYRFQAGYALRFSLRSGKKKDYCQFNDCVLDYMLSSCTANLSLNSMFSRQFKNLLAYDRDHDTSLRETLECYLRNESSISETARELYLHRSSLIKRLDRIKELLECDLTNPKLNLYYRMCLELLNRNST